ncbi:MAG: T9SS type A sorting domain-containing protein [Flavobacteriales bacterium]|nr:T9SS type A sorting domain-containing protein [Flavobacteriales bacterium]MBK6945730.1 T9SS type A sorting domain-containing protein [Flavobacteriales bacterium]MBK7241828.1 T9SS type A sorting domain-containing protein [Flavobacteriales bacterium]MBK9534721.1 T9SS type A sorting domain-containing protein [Flavobacteriales bacterium]MBP9139908.1 T9SS type A sorting domain-containing protein [Flavobacteriales bacterium]
MKKTIPIITLCIVTVALMAFNDPSSVVHKNAGGAIAGYCGDPAGGSLTCTACHEGPHATPVIGLITSDIPAEGYTPNTTYTITAMIASAGHTRFGFEISPQNPDGDFIGTLVNTGTETQLNGAGSNYITHSFDGIEGEDSRTWTFDWIAPPQGTGSATFYGAFNVTNSDFTQNEDTIYTSTLLVPEALSTSTAELGTTERAFTVFPNPTTALITIKTSSLVGSMFMITDQAGHQVSSGKLNNVSTTIDLSRSAAGAYSVRIGEQGVQTLKVIKQ